MFRGLKRLRILFALIISLSVPVLSGYLLCCDVAEDDLFSPDAMYEDEDLDDLFLLPVCQNQLKFPGSIESNALFPVFLPEINTIDQVSVFCPLSSSLERITLVLRC
jgi:hypothetical protein